MSLGSINFQQKSLQTVENEKLCMPDIIKDINYKIKHYWNIFCMNCQECEQILYTGEYKFYLNLASSGPLFFLDGQF